MLSRRDEIARADGIRRFAALSRKNFKAIARSTALAACMGLSLFSAPAASQTYVLGDPCTTIGETRLSSDQMSILACLEKDTNKGAVQGNLFWKDIGGIDGVPTMECTSAFILANPLRVSIYPGGDPNALMGYGNATEWGGRCLNDYVLTGCSGSTGAWPFMTTRTFRNPSNTSVKITYLDYQQSNDFGMSLWLDRSSSQSCSSGDAEWRMQNAVEVMCCHLVSK